MAAQLKEPSLPSRNIRVQPVGRWLFNICDDQGNFLGTANGEVTALWRAVELAEHMARDRAEVSVVIKRDGKDVVEFVARPR